MKTYLFPLFPLLLVIGWITADEAQLNEKLRQIARRHEVVGMSVVVTDGRQVAFSFSHGHRDLERQLPIDKRTRYRIASISKMFTATALLRLYEQGRFKLEDQAGTYLGYPLINPNYAGQPITFRQLLAHTSSLRDGKGYSAFLRATSQNPPPDLQQLLTPTGKYYTRDMFAAHSPASDYFCYANINYGVIATLIEKLTRQRFDQYCRRNILLPLKLGASFNIHQLPDIDDVAALYRRQNGQWIAQADNYQGHYPPPRDLSLYQPGSNGLLFAPQGGLRISADELACFLLFHQSGASPSSTLLQPETLALMHQSVWNYQGNNGNNYYGIFNSYALGNHTTRDLLSGENLTGHPGEAYGLISDMYFCRDGNYGIIFICNGGIWDKGSYCGWYDIEEKVFQVCREYIKIRRSKS